MRKILDKIYPLLYRFLKRNRVLLKPIRKLTVLLPKVKAKVAAIFSNKQSNYPVPNRSYSRTAEWILENQLKFEDKMIGMKEIHPPLTYERVIPGYFESELFWKFKKNQRFHLPPTFVAHLPNARIIDDGYVITSDNALLEDVSVVIAPKSDKHPVFEKEGYQMYSPFLIKGKAVLLATYAGRGFYHWMIDVLPRIELLHKAGINFEEIDKFIINSYLTSYQVETLEILGIPREKLVETQWKPHIVVEMLVLPSLTNVYQTVPKWTCDFLRRSFLNFDSNTIKTGKKIYISRGQASHRRVINELQLVELLKDFGFEAMTLEGMKVTEQAKLFAGASFVIAPHGAGLTNLVYCSPKTKVIELIYPGSINLMFWTIASQINLNYHYFFAQGELPAEDTEPYLNSVDMEIDLEKLKQFILKIEKGDS